MVVFIKFIKWIDHNWSGFQRINGARVMTKQTINIYCQLKSKVNLSSKLEGNHKPKWFIKFQLKYHYNRPARGIGTHRKIANSNIKLDSVNYFFLVKLFHLKGPKHDQVEGEFFYIKQTRMVRWLRDWRKKCILFMIGADIRLFLFLANAEHTLKIMWRMLSIGLKVHKHEIFFNTFFAETETIWSQGPVTRDF